MALRSIRSIDLLCMGFNLIVTILSAVDVLLTLHIAAACRKVSAINLIAASERLFTSKLLVK